MSMNLTRKVTWTNKDENSVLEITGIPSGNWLLRRIRQVVSGGGSAATHGPILSETNSFGTGDINEIMRVSAVAVASKVDIVLNPPIQFHVPKLNSDPVGTGTIFLKLGFDAGASGNDDGTTILSLEFLGGTEKSSSV